MKIKKMALNGLEMIRILAAEHGENEAISKVKTYISMLEAATVIKSKSNRGDRETLQELKLGLAALAALN